MQQAPSEDRRRYPPEGPYPRCWGSIPIQFKRHTICVFEEEGIIVSRSGTKSYTNVNAETVERIRRELLAKDTQMWVKAMKGLGVSAKEAFALAEKLWEV